MADTHYRKQNLPLSCHGNNANTRYGRVMSGYLDIKNTVGGNHFSANQKPQAAVPSIASYVANNSTPICAYLRTKPPSPRGKKKVEKKPGLLPKTSRGDNFQHGPDSWNQRGKKPWWLLINYKPPRLCKKPVAILGPHERRESAKIQKAKETGDIGAHTDGSDRISLSV